MGLVDGCAPALLSQRSTSHHDGTGIVYTLNTMAVQCGFIFGPIVGASIMEAVGFEVMSAVLGLGMVAVSPAMLVNKGMPLPGGEGEGEGKGYEMAKVDEDDEEAEGEDANNITGFV